MLVWTNLALLEIARPGSLHTPRRACSSASCSGFSRSPPPSGTTTPPAECEQQVGARPVQVCHGGNTAVHAAEYEGRPEPVLHGRGGDQHGPITRGCDLARFLAQAAEES